jgi:hypothetical protein
MRLLTEQAFAEAIGHCIHEKVDFVIIAGDLFHTALPPMDSVKTVFRSLKRLHDSNIPLYFIAGSHDYSPTGKTMLDVIEEAGLGRNLFRGKVEDGKLRLKWTLDAKTGVKLTGILGRANQLDQAIYEDIDRAALEGEGGEKIFVFHTGLAELDGDKAFDTAPASLLPQGCRYYAGGHVHARTDTVVDGKRIVYPGPLFPASFSELEELGGGSFVIVEDWNVRRVALKTKVVVAYSIDCNGMEPLAVVPKVLSELADVKDALVLVRASGELRGKPSDVDWKGLSDELSARGAYAVLRNTLALLAPKSENVKVSTGTVDEIESAVLREQDIDEKLARELMQALAQEMRDGEKKQSYEDRVISEGKDVLTQNR